MERGRRGIGRERKGEEKELTLVVSEEEQDSFYTTWNRVEIMYHVAPWLNSEVSPSLFLFLSPSALLVIVPP
jgi:hypothetical protein